MAIFEMCTKLVKQVRSLASGVLQNVVPKIATLTVTQPIEKIKEAYLKINKINTILLFFSVVLIIPFAKVFSLLLLGTVEPTFIWILTFLVIGWGINSLNIPAYMVNLGTGDLKWNVISHLVIGVLNLLLCFVIGYLFKNGVYIILSWIIALILGSLIIIIEYHHRNKLPLSVIFDVVFFKLFSYFGLLVLLNYLVGKTIDNIWLSTGITVGLLLLYMGAAIGTITPVKTQIKAILKLGK